MTKFTYGKNKVYLKGDKDQDVKEVEVNELDVTHSTAWKRARNETKNPKILFVPASNPKIDKDNKDEWMLSYRAKQLEIYIREFYKSKYIVEKIALEKLPAKNLSHNTAIILCIQGHGSEKGTIDGYDAQSWYDGALAPFLEKNQNSLRLIYVFGCHGAALAMGYNRLTKKPTEGGGLQKILGDKYNISVRGMWQNMTVTVEGKPVGKNDRSKIDMQEYDKLKADFDSWIAKNEDSYKEAQAKRQKYFTYEYPFVSPAELEKVLADSKKDK